LQGHYFPTKIGLFAIAERHSHRRSEIRFTILSNGKLLNIVAG
jgi:hypothetical protein